MSLFLSSAYILLTQLVVQDPPPDPRQHRCVIPNHLTGHNADVRTDDPYTLVQLRDPRMNALIVRPLVDRLYDPKDCSVGEFLFLGIPTQDSAKSATHSDCPCRIPSWDRSKHAETQSHRVILHVIFAF